MVNLASVHYHDERVGAVFWNESRRCAEFEYDPAFVQTGRELSPILMPLRSGVVYAFPALNRDTFKGLPGMLADALPDRFGDALIDQWLARQGRNPGSYTSVERLCFQHTRSMGALTFEPAESERNQITHDLEIAQLVEATRIAIAHKSTLQATRNRQDNALLQVLQVGTSAGGARAKAVIAYNRSTKEIRSGQIDAPAGFEHWIVKLDGVQQAELRAPKHYGRIEYAYANMARACGIVMSPCELWEENGRAHFMTKRFDRNGNARIHMQTLCGIAHFDYNSPGYYSYEQLFQIMRQLKLPFSDAEQMFRRMLFHVVARNQDDHTKNTSFLMDHAGVWRLAPAYDETFCYNPNGDHTSKHQMTIQGKADGFTRDDILAVAKQISLKKPLAIIQDVNDAVSNWARFASEAGVSMAQIRRIGALHRVGML